MEEATTAPQTELEELAGKVLNEVGFKETEGKQEEKQEEPTEKEEERAKFVERFEELVHKTNAQPIAKPITKPIPIPNVTLQPSKVVKFSAEELNAAAEKILNVIQDYAAEGLRDMAENQLTIPLWQYLAGIIFSTYNEGRMGVVDLDPAWSEEGFGDTYHQCIICEKEFTPKAMGQMVCCHKCGIVLAERSRIGEEK